MSDKTVGQRQKRRPHHPIGCEPMGGEKMTPEKEKKICTETHYFLDTGPSSENKSGARRFFRKSQFCVAQRSVLPNVRRRHSAQLFLELSHRKFCINRRQTCESSISESVRLDFLSSRSCCWPAARVRALVCWFTVPHFDAFCRPTSVRISASTLKCIDGVCADNKKHPHKQKHP